MTSVGPSPYLRKASGLVRNISATDALICNMTFMGFLFASYELTFGAGLYPGANLPLSFALVIPASLIVALTYALLTTAMPRTGGDYVFVGRIISPPLGFMVNFYFTMVLVTWVGSVVPIGTQYGIAGIFTSLGMIWNNPSLLSIGSALGGFNVTSFVVSAVVILLCISVLFAGTRAVVNTAWALFILGIIGVIVYLVAILSVGHDTIVANFNALSGTTYDKVLSAASSSPGYPQGFTTSGTMLGTVYIFLGSLGYTGSAYFAGEVRGVSRSQMIAIVGSVLIFAAVVWPVYALTYWKFVGDFVNGISYLSVIGDASVSSLPTFPSLAFFTVFATQNPIVNAYVNLAVELVSIGSCGIVIPFIAVRNLFAWSYDRVMPAKLAQLDRRGSPIVAIAVILIASEVTNYLYYFTNIFRYLTYSMLGWFIATAIVCLAAAAFPFRRKDIFDAAPSICKNKIAGIPVISVLGVLGFFVSIAVAASTISPAYSGTLSYEYVVAILLTLVAGPVIYYASYYYQKRHGIPIELAHSQLPPE